MSFPSMSRGVKIALAAGALALLGGCTSTFNARVQSFQAMPQYQGQSFAIVPTDEKRSESLEYQTYAQLVAAELQKNGMVQARSPEEASFVVSMDFGIGPPVDRLGTRPTTTSSWGWWGSPWGPWGPRSMWWGSFYDPFWGPGYRSEVYSYTQYPAYLQVGIVRRADRAPLFEARAESNTRVNDLPAHMPRLVTALFTDFPGPPSRSHVVRVPTGN